ncbi:MAG: ATP-dependent helicase/nuclease subunit [Pseudomonadota bacterium]
MSTTISLPPTLIRASAGSGKTFQLTNRFLKLLLLGESPDRILATTFTRKAAGEIAERVFSRLSDAILDEKKLRALAHELELPKLTRREAGGALRRLVLHEHRLNICTLDSFFHGIAAAFGLEIGLQPGWTVADSFAVERLLEEGVKRLCDKEGYDELSTLLQLMRGGKAGRRVIDDLKTLVTALLDVFRSTERRQWEWLNNSIPQPQVSLAALVGAVRGFPIPLTKSGTPRKHWAAALPRLAAAAETGDWEALFANGIVKKVISDEATFDSIPLEDPLRPVCEELLVHAARDLLTKLAAQNSSTFTLLAHLNDEIEELKRATRILDFSDVKHRLSSSAALGALDEVYYRLDTRIAHILFDEFQDTSRAEWSIVEPMVEEILSKSAGEHSFLCVGDTKQAIYGWRGGVAEIFQRLKRRWDQLKELPLAETRRCSVGVIDGVNAIFTSIAANPALADYREGAESWGQRFDPHRTVKTERAGYTALECVDGATAEAIRGGVEARAIEIVADLLQKPGDFTIGILTRGNAAVGRIMFALQNAQIRASDESKSSLLDSPAVETLRALLRLADHPADTVSRFHLANSPLGDALGYHDWESDHAAAELGRQIREEAATRGFGAALAHYGELLLPGCSDRDRSRVAQCIEQAHLYTLGEATRISEFNRWLEHVSLETGRSERVRVMTIHQSKGLEFDAVILVDIDGAMIKRGAVNSVPILTYSEDPTEPPTRVSRRPRSELLKLEPRLGAMAAQGDAETIKDNLSVLYVAMTRARYALYAITGMSDKELSLGKVLRFGLGGGDAPGLRYETGSRTWYTGYEPEDKPVPRLTHKGGAAILAPSPVKRRRGLLRETPSGREGGTEIALKDILRVRGAEAAEYGRLIHRLFQQVEWAHEIPDEAELLTLLERDFIGVDDPHQTIAQFRSLIAASEITAELTPMRYKAWGVEALEVLREQSFAVRVGDAVMTGTFDRLVIGVRSGRPCCAHIIDYKTDRVRDEAQIESRIAFYTPQIEAYIDAAEQFTRLPREAISATLLFVTPGLTHNFETGRRKGT